MAMPKGKVESIDKEIKMLGYGKRMTMKKIRELSLKDFETLEDYNNRYKYLTDLLQRIACELSSMESWKSIMESKTVVSDFLD